MKFDIDQQGYILTSELQPALEDLDEHVTENEVFRMIAQMDPQNTGQLNSFQFKQLVMERREDAQGTSDADLLDAYVAMGGDEDGGGCVDADKLIRTIKTEFEMTIDIEALIQEVDEDGSGEIEFDEFKELLGGGDGDDDDDDEDEGGKGGD